MAISVPWSVSLGKNDHKLDAEIHPDGDPSYNFGKLKLHIGANADVSKRQVLVGSFEALSRFMLRYMQDGVYTGTSGYCKGPWDDAKDSNIVFNQGAPTANEVALVIAADFVGDATSTGSGSHFVDRVWHDLIEVFLTESKDN